jgi:tRNA pseudouridine38-40 synthase
MKCHCIESSQRHPLYASLLRWKVMCAYDGTDYAGWQIQPNAITVQGTIEIALSHIFKKPIRIHGSGRTDAGVHANGQIFHFEALWPHGPDVLKKALQPLLPKTLQILQIETADATFHARYSAKRKQYIYRMHKAYASVFDQRYAWSLGYRTLNISAMQQAAALLIGTHDFSGFAVKRSEGSKENPVKTLLKLEIVDDDPWLVVTTQGSGYLYKMVRTMVGALIAVGQNQLSVDDIQNILMTGVRPLALVTAPPHGLYLDQVFYG